MASLVTADGSVIGDTLQRDVRKWKARGSEHEAPEERQIDATRHLQKRVEIGDRGEAAKSTSKTSATTSMVRLRGRCLRGERLIGYARHGQWKTITFVAGLAASRDGRPLRVRRGHQWTDVSRLRKAMSRSHTQAQRYRDHGQSSGTQDRRCRGGDRSGGRDAALSSAVLARPQSDRAGFQQSEGPCVQS